MITLKFGGIVFEHLWGNGNTIFENMPQAELVKKKKSEVLKLYFYLTYWKKWEENNEDKISYQFKTNNSFFFIDYSCFRCFYYTGFYDDSY